MATSRMATDGAVFVASIYFQIIIDQFYSLLWSHVQLLLRVFTSVEGEKKKMTNKKNHIIIIP